jgi:hypothetical protein
MLKTILTLGTGVALGCYYKSHKDKNKLSDEKKDDESTLESDVKGKSVMSKIKLLFNKS